MTTMTTRKIQRITKENGQTGEMNYVDVMAEIESNEDLDMTSDWLDNHMEEIFKWANTDDEKVLAELRSDYFKLKGMLLC